MSVPGKKRYYFYLTEEYVNSVRGLLAKGNYKGGMSGYIDDILKNAHETLVESGIAKKQAPVTSTKLFRMWLNGLKKR